MTVFFSHTTSNKFVINFGNEIDGKDWYVVNDGVMGGLSSSEISFSKNSILFEGEVSLENNGGFASMRSSRKQLDLSQYETVTVRFRSSSTDRIFALRLNTNDMYYRPSYNQNFRATSDNWQQISFDLADFKETILGKETGSRIPKQKLKKIIRLGIMLNDKKEGPFLLEIDTITFQ